MFGIGPMEVVIGGIVGVLLFGHRLPQMARSLGSAIPQFKRGIKEVEQEIAEIESETKKIAKEL